MADSDEEDFKPGRRRTAEPGGPGRRLTVDPDQLSRRRSAAPDEASRRPSGDAEEQPSRRRRTTVSDEPIRRSSEDPEQQPRRRRGTVNPEQVKDDGDDGKVKEESATTEGKEKADEGDKEGGEQQKEKSKKLNIDSEEMGDIKKQKQPLREDILKHKVGEGWVKNKGLKMIRDTESKRKSMERSRSTKKSSVVKPRKQFTGPQVPINWDEVDEDLFPDMELLNRPSELKRVERGYVDNVVPESSRSARKGTLLELPVKPIIPSDEEIETQSMLQEAMSRLMFGAIEERLVRGDIHRTRHPDRPQTDLEKLLDLEPVDLDDELMGEGEEYPGFLLSEGTGMGVEEFILSERQLLEQEAYRDAHPMEKPVMRRKPRRLSEVIQEIEDDFRMLHDAQEEWGSAEGEEEEEAVAEEEREMDAEEYEEMMEKESLRQQGRELVAAIQRFRGEGFGRNLGDILGMESLRKYQEGFEDVKGKGISKSEMNFLISVLQQKLAEEKEQNERMLVIMRNRRSRAKRMYDLEEMFGLQRRSMRLNREEEESDLQMLWDYIDEAMVVKRKEERYM